MTYEQAYELARAWVRIVGGEGIDVLFEHTIQKPYGWIFFYNTKEWIATGDPNYSLVGNAPIIVGIDGEIRITGTAHPLEYYLARYEATLPPARLQRRSPHST
jgi:hypothetical protein